MLNHEFEAPLDYFSTENYRKFNVYFSANTIVVHDRRYICC